VTFPDSSYVYGESPSLVFAMHLVILGNLNKSLITIMTAATKTDHKVNHPVLCRPGCSNTQETQMVKNSLPHLPSHTTHTPIYVQPVHKSVHACIQTCQVYMQLYIISMTWICSFVKLIFVTNIARSRGTTRATWSRLGPWTQASPYCK
jgi:hypothetical protein